jgi:hypothetical protein
MTFGYEFCRPKILKGEALSTKMLIFIVDFKDRFGTSYFSPRGTAIQCKLAWWSGYFSKGLHPLGRFRQRGVNNKKVFAINGVESAVVPRPLPLFSYCHCFLQNYSHSTTAVYFHCLQVFPVLLQKCQCSISGVCSTDGTYPISRVFYGFDNIANISQNY